MQKATWKTAALALAAAGLLTLLAGLGVLRRPDLAASDLLYQRRAATNGEIVIIGIDQQSLEELGPFNQWGRDVYAAALETLNQSEDCRPAVIGLDVLFVGETSPEEDARLAQAAGKYGNVVVACAADFDSVYVEDSHIGHLDAAVVGFDQPYEALAATAAQGHINARLDYDGILRRHLLSYPLPDGSQAHSQALVLANAYRAWYGQPPVERPPCDRDGLWYLPFTGGPGSFEEIPLSSVLMGDVPAEYFAGKIVLIGPYAVGLQDSYITSADHAQPMYGIEVQANAIQALLDGNFKREAAEALQLLLLFLLLLLALWGFWGRSVKASTALWAALCIGWLLVCWGAYRMGWLLHVLWVPAAVSVLYASCLALNYIRAALERQKVTNTFKRYVAPEIVNELLKEGPEALALGGRLTNIAVLFVDVRGFTPMSELLGPEQVVEILNRYLTLISDCILRNGGTLDKFVGDAAMAFWGAPLPQEDYVMQAVMAAMDMVEGSRALSEELMARFGRTVSFGIGVHLGEAVVGNIGSPQRMDYTAIGDTVNTAARLEANAPGGTIYISHAVAQALEGRIQTTSLGGSVRLKGKKEGFEVLTLDRILP